MKTLLPPRARATRNSQNKCPSPRWLQTVWAAVRTGTLGVGQQGIQPDARPAEQEERSEEDSAAEHQHDLVHVSRHSAVRPLVHLELLESQTAENQGEDIDDQDGKLYSFSLRPVIGKHIDARTHAARSCPEQGEEGGLAAGFVVGLETVLAAELAAVE
jgi:hypothetical protein